MLIILLILTFPITGFLFVLIHELGHALIGAMVGFVPCRIDLGSGREIFSFEIFTMRFVVHQMAFSGLTQLLPIAPRGGYRWKMILVMLGGSMADALVLCAIVLLNLHSDGVSDLIAFVVGVEIFMIFSNLFPRHVTVNGKKLGSDARQIIDLISGRTTDPFIELQNLLRQGLEEYGPSIDPDSFLFLGGNRGAIARFMNGSIALGAGDFAYTVVAFEKLLDYDLTTAERGMFLVILCSLVTNHDMKEYLERADQWSRTAYELLPERRPVIVIRAVTLIAMGEYRTGITMLLPLASEVDDPATKAITIANLALAHYRLGEEDEAREWMGRVATMVPRTIMVTRIAEEIGLTELDLRIGPSLLRYGASEESGPINFLGNDPNAILRFGEGEEALANNDFDAAIEAYEDLLHNHDLTDAEGGLLLDTLCGIVIDHDRREYLAQADEWSNVVHELLPTIPTIIGTRAAILIEGGDYGAGITMLTPLTTNENEKINRVRATSYLAKAYHHLGDAEKAQRWLRCSREIDPEDSMLLRIEREMGSTAR